MLIGKYCKLFSLINQGVTLYTPTVIFEFYDVNATFIIFFMVLVYCGLYATGCLMFLSVLITNIVNIVLVIAVLLAVGSTSVSENMVFLMYLLMVFVVGASFLYLLEKSRKQVSISAQARRMTLLEFCI